MRKSPKNRRGTAGGPVCRPYSRSGSGPFFFVGPDTGRPADNRPTITCSAKPGAELGPQRMQFLQTQGPVARREFRVSLRFCAPKMLCPVHGVTPVMGSGADSPCQGEMARRARGGRVGDYEHEVLIGARPRGVLFNLPCLPAKPSTAGSPGRGGARERAQFRRQAETETSDSR